MNQGHKNHIKRNRLSRCKKRLTSKELSADQRSRLSQRQAELELEVSKFDK